MGAAVGEESGVGLAGVAGLFLDRARERGVELLGRLRDAVQERIEALEIGLLRHRVGAFTGRGEPHGFDFRLRLAEFGENAQCFRRFGLVDPAHGETDMDQHPIADA